LLFRLPFQVWCSHFLKNSGRVPLRLDQLPHPLQASAIALRRSVMVPIAATAFQTSSPFEPNAEMLPIIDSANFAVRTE
jgi:hypothetical protein